MFSSEMDPFQNMRAVLEGLSDQEGSGSSGPTRLTSSLQGAQFTMEELHSLQEAYMAEAKQLQTEIIDLEKDLEEENMATLSIPNSTLRHLRNILKIKNNEQGMQDMHKMQASLSGVHLTDATVKVLSNNPDRIIRSQRLEGSCSGLGFAATFKVEETLVRTSPEENEEKEEEGADGGEERRAVIRSLDLEVEPSSLEEMMTFLQDAEKGCRLQPFLRGYSQFAFWFQHRARTFTHFKALYPDSVSLPGGPTGRVMQIICPLQKGIVYTIMWDIEVSRSGRATPNIRLCVKWAQEVAKLDTQKTLQRAPEEFGKMVDTLGVERALDAFLRAVSAPA
ncbi:centromere protein P-like [Diadema setosum]|uniref:centromere protein P-like n=1 Tax=Diadema setosum TaxID=31175 RepID=UPI003B3BCB69